MCIDLFDVTLKVSDQLEVVPVNVFMLRISRPSSSADFGESATYVDFFLLLFLSRCACDFHTLQSFKSSFSVGLTLFVCLVPLIQGFAVTGHIDSQRNSRIFVSEVLPDGLAFNEGDINGITRGIRVTLTTSFLKQTLVCVPRSASRGRDPGAERPVCVGPGPGTHPDAVR